MDPSHLITPPRAHPSGIGNGLDDHHHQRKQPQNMLHEPWFIVLISIVLLLFSFIATVAMIIFRRRHQITKEVGHLNGNLYNSFYTPLIHFRTHIEPHITTHDDNTNSSNSLLCYCFLLSLSTVPVVNANDITALNINGKESLWIDRGWRAGDTDKDSGLSETKLLGNSNSMQSGNYTDGGTDYAEVDTRNMSTFYNCRKVCRVKQTL